MHISEAYEHDPLLSVQPEEVCCPVSGCDKMGTQCVDVAASLLLVPTTVVGTPSVRCDGVPRVSCVTDPTGTSCTVTMTQRVCVSVVIRYGVSVTEGEPTIGCAASGT